MALVEFNRLGSVHGPTQCLCHFDFSSSLKTVLGQAEYERMFGGRVSVLSPSLTPEEAVLFNTIRQYNFTSVIDGVLARMGEKELSLGLNRRFATAHYETPPELSLQLPKEPLVFQVYMLRGRRGDGDEDKGKKGASGGSYFGFSLEGPPGGAKHDLRESVIHELPEDDRDGKPAPADDSAPAAAEPKVQMRRKESKKAKPLSLVKRISTVYGCDENSPAVQALLARLNLPETATDAEVAQRVGTIYGFEGADFEVLAKRIADGQTFRSSFIERFNIEQDAMSQFFERLEWGRSGSSGDASLKSSIRASVICALDIGPGDLDQIKRGALVLGVDLSKLTSAQVKEHDPEEVLVALSSDGGADVQLAVRLFDEKNEQGFKDLVRQKYDILLQQRELLEETRGQVSRLKKANKDNTDEYEGLCTLRNLLTDKVGTSEYGQILFEVYTHAGILSHDGKPLLDNPVFQFLATDPKFEDTFKRLKASHIRKRLMQIDEDTRIPLSERLAEIEKTHTERLKTMLESQAELQKDAKAQLLKMGRHADADVEFDEEYARQELARLNAQHEKEAYALRKSMNICLYEALFAELNQYIKS